MEGDRGEIGPSRGERSPSGAASSQSRAEPPSEIVPRCGGAAEMAPRFAPEAAGISRTTDIRPSGGGGKIDGAVDDAEIPAGGGGKVDGAEVRAGSEIRTGGGGNLAGDSGGPELGGSPSHLGDSEIGSRSPTVEISPRSSEIAPRRASLSSSVARSSVASRLTRRARNWSIASDRLRRASSPIASAPSPGWPAP